MKLLPCFVHDLAVRLKMKINPTLEEETGGHGLLRSLALPVVCGSAKVKIDFCSTCDIA